MNQLLQIALRILGKIRMQPILLLTLSSLLITRTSFILLTTTRSTTMKPSSREQNVSEVEGTVISQMNIPLTSTFHPPPSAQQQPHQQQQQQQGSEKLDIEYYRNNTTPFGAILRGESPARVLHETDTLLAFVDISPQSKTLHALVIPKRYIPTINELNPIMDLPLLHDMEQVGFELVHRFNCDNNYRMVFHVPPFNSVDHLHLHVICNSDITSYGRMKYYYNTDWCISMQRLLQIMNKMAPRK
jgi:diadenosine tetraphosphate (Ap4A) HIT family hydrolase